MTVQRIDHQPEPPACPDWCDTDPGWVTTIGGTAQTCCCTVPAGVDVDGDAVLVQVQRHAFLDDDQVRACEPVVQVCCWGMLDVVNAATLASAISHAATLAQDARGVA